MRAEEASPPPDEASVVEASVAELRDLGAAPDAVREIVRITSDEAGTIDQLRGAICRDPGIAVRVLKVVNSAYYGLGGQLDSIHRAIAMLGFEAIRQIALATTVLPLFRRCQLNPAFDVQELGKHCLGVAAGASLLAERSGVVGRERAFLAGLLHDVGILVEVRTLREAFMRTLHRFHDPEQSEPARSFRALERAELGADHERFGAALCRKWRFPEKICAAVGRHHEPEPSTATLSGVVHVADVLAARNGIGYTGTVERTELPEEQIEALGMDLEAIDAIEAELPGAALEMERLMG